MFTKMEHGVIADYELTRRDLCFAAGFGTLGKSERISEMLT